MLRSESTPLRSTSGQNYGICRYITFHTGSVKEQVPIIVFGYGTPHTPSRKDGRSPVESNKRFTIPLNPEKAPTSQRVLGTLIIECRFSTVGIILYTVMIWESTHHDNT